MDAIPYGRDLTGCAMIAETIAKALGGCKAGGSWMARCPAHDDRHASLGVSRGADGRVLLHCHAGCRTLDICHAMGIALSALFAPGGNGDNHGRIVAEYDYRDAEGNLLFQTVRFEPKDFRQRRPDGNGGWIWKLGRTARVLYRLPEVATAEDSKWVFVVEGEKDADALAAMGLIATTNPMGAGKWHKLSDDSALHGRRVAIVPDRDEAGRRHAQTVARALQNRASDIRIVELPGDGKDVSDWIGAGGTAADLLAIVEAAPVHCPGEHAESPDASILIPGAYKDDQDRCIEQSNATFADAVLAALPQDAIYRKDFIPGELLGCPGRRKWVELTVDRMRIVTDSHVRLAKWVTSRKSQKQALIYQPCSKDAAGVIIAQARQAPHVRELNLIVSYPVYDPGFVRVPPGWHDGLFYDEPPELHDLSPEMDREVIQAALDDLVVDFPFKSQADRHNFFGLLLTPIVAPALDGSRPMHLVNSPLERTGKTKLVNEVFGGVLIGREAPAMQITEREEEREKRILAMLLAGETLMHLDNLPRYIDSASLSSLLTAHVFGGRVLGASRTVKLVNNLTIVGTGNNVAASGEIAKRIVPIMIEPTMAHPESRTDFQHPDVRGHVRQHRRLILECLLGMVENWLAAGRPKHPDRFGGFESWSETIGGILEVNGLRAWRTNEAKWRTQADQRGAEMEAFVRAWQQAFPDQQKDVGPKALRELAKSCNLFERIFAKRTEAAVNVAFGRMLSHHVDAPIDKWFIRRAGASNHVRYYLEEIK